MRIGEVGRLPVSPHDRPTGVPMARTLIHAEWTDCGFSFIVNGLAVWGFDVAEPVNPR